MKEHIGNTQTEVKEKLHKYFHQLQRAAAALERLQASVQIGQATITPDRLKALSVAMQKRLAEGPPELRQA